MIRFLADASLHDAIVQGVAAESLRRLSLSARGQTGSRPDPEVLTFAAEHERILVTSDLRTMPQVWGASNSDEWKNRIIEIPQ